VPQFSPFSPQQLPQAKIPRLASADTSTDAVMGLGVSTGSTDTVVGGSGGGLPGAGW
jgi:hypothetical protein